MAEIPRARFAAGLTVVVTLAVLSLGSNSGPLAETVAVFANEPEIPGLRTIVAPACVPSGRNPRSQTTALFERPHDPCVAVANTKVETAGRGFTIRTALSPLGVS